MERLILRPIRQEEIPEAAALIRRVMLEVNSRDYRYEYLMEYVRRYGPEELAALVNAPGCRFYVACLGTELAGCGGLAPSKNRPGALEVRSVYVRPDLEGKGIGRAIIKTLEADPLCRTADRLVVSASLTARGFYKRLGYDDENGICCLEYDDHYWMERFPGRG